MTLPLFELLPTAVLQHCTHTISPSVSFISANGQCVTSDGRVLYCWQPRLFTSGQQLWIYEGSTQKMEWVDWERSSMRKVEVPNGHWAVNCFVDQSSLNRSHPTFWIPL